MESEIHYLLLFFEYWQFIDIFAILTLKNPIWDILWLSDVVYWNELLHSRDHCSMLGHICSEYESNDSFSKMQKLISTQLAHKIALIVLKNPESLSCMEVLLRWLIIEVNGSPGHGVYMIVIIEAVMT